MSAELHVIDDCWNRIGVRGDHSCAELKTVIHCQNCSVFGAASQAFFDRPITLDYQRELTRLVAETPDAHLESTRSVIVFALGEELFALDTRCFVEVAEPQRVRRVPHRTNRVFSGLVSIHGQLELSFSLAGLLAVEGANKPLSVMEPRHSGDALEAPTGVSADSRARTLVVEDERRRRWVFAATEVLGIQRVPDSGFLEAPSTLSRKSTSHVERVILWEGRRVGYLDSTSLFAALERSLR